MSVDGPPEIPSLTVDPYEHLVQMPLPSADGTHAFGSASPDLGPEDRPKPVPPEPDRLVADVGPALVQQVLDIPERKRKANVQHDRKADDFRAGSKAAKQVRIAHPRMLRVGPARLKGPNLTPPAQIVIDG